MTIKHELPAFDSRPVTVIEKRCTLQEGGIDHILPTEKANLLYVAVGPKLIKVLDGKKASAIDLGQPIYSLAYNQNLREDETPISAVGAGNSLIFLKDMKIIDSRDYQSTPIVNIQPEDGLFLVTFQSGERLYASPFSRNIREEVQPLNAALGVDLENNILSIDLMKLTRFQLCEDSSVIFLPGDFTKFFMCLTANKGRWALSWDSTELIIYDRENLAEYPTPLQGIQCLSIGTATKFYAGCKDGSVHSIVIWSNFDVDSGNEVLLHIQNYSRRVRP